MQLIVTRRVSRDTSAAPDDVRILKKALNRLRFYMPDPERGITKIADADMIEALKKFQTAHGLRPDGVLLPGDDTVRAMNTMLADQEGKVKLVWCCPKDKNSCDACIARDGTAVDDESEDTPDCRGNCRCWVTDAGMETPVIYDPPIEPVYPEVVLLPAIKFPPLRSALETLRLIRKILLQSPYLSAIQEASLMRFIKKIPANSKDTVKVTRLKNGEVKFTASSAGRVPGSRAVYEKTVDSQGKTIKYTKTTYDEKNRIIHTKDKLNKGVIND